MFQCTKHKRAIVNIFLVIFLIVYALFGGLVFYIFEKDISEVHDENKKNSILNCTLQVINRRRRPINDEVTKGRLKDCFQECTGFEEWTWVRGSVLAFASITTIGYGALRLVSHKARLFFIFYCLIGMPVGLILLANLGKFMEESIGHAIEKIKNRKKNRIRKRLSKICPQNTKQESSVDDNDEEEFKISKLLLLLIFILYVIMGVLVITLNREINIVDGLFTIFVSLTALDASDMLTLRNFLLPVSIAYITGGLALATIAIGVLGKYLKQLRNIGKKLTNRGKIKIWFGGKSLSVKNLVQSVGEAWGIDQDKIASIDLDKVIDEKLSKMEDVLGPNVETNLEENLQGKNFQEWRKLALRKVTDQSPGKPKFTHDPQMLHILYQNEWKLASPEIVNRTDTTRSSRHRNSCYY